ncbi:Acireductone dioxygenase [Nadsonia fulvescens var. elongata DSM 6958]|uniref:Acireductone dioxygenase n=1 Tax=Nadsonia fulvescens var. elongata DSM 6958 TaxID=857566 RepID=A0A1E3PGB7_9ASCO|nr:Acireductone dioxygenase [Nadsonia fulvescens var. elongata DSM 6958]
MKAYIHDGDDSVSQFAPHLTDTLLTSNDLDSIGVIYKHLPTIMEVDALAESRAYVSRDTIEVSPATLPEYETKMKSFYQEHLHEDEEIRYILEGEGYFDVRSKDDQNWVRVLLEKGDLLILPAGIYHRFTNTETNYIKALRLFQLEPKWIALNRPVENNKYRNEYLNSIQ